MTARRLTDDERAARLERRAARRAAAAAKVAEVRAWREARAAAAAEAAAAAVAARRSTARGVDRVPDRYRGLVVVEKPHTHGKRPGPDGQLVPIDSELGAFRFRGKTYVGTHDERRAVGQRGKARRSRTRELPGAVIRRLERAQKEWTS